jgi:hypothetical protein
MSMIIDIKAATCYTSQTLNPIFRAGEKMSDKKKLVQTASPKKPTYCHNNNPPPTSNKWPENPIDTLAEKTHPASPPKNYPTSS